MAVTTYNDISSQVTEAKMTVHIGDFQICARQLPDDNISSYLTETEITVHICVCASIPCKLDFFSFLVFASEVKDTI